MKKPLLGLLIALAAAVAGFFWGRSARFEAQRLAAAVRAVAADRPSSVGAAASDAAAPAGLPSDQRQGDSVPQGLE